MEYGYSENERIYNFAETYNGYNMTRYMRGNVYKYYLSRAGYLIKKHI